MERDEEKIALINKETPVNEMFKVFFLEQLDEYTYHSFMAKW